VRPCGQSSVVSLNKKLSSLPSWGPEGVSNPAVYTSLVMLWKQPNCPGFSHLLGSSELEVSSPTPEAVACTKQRLEWCMFSDFLGDDS